MNISFSPRNITSMEDLNAILNHLKTDTSKWIKNASRLFQEVVDGECVLHFDGTKLSRCVNVVEIKCFSNYMGNRCQLIEEIQIFTNGMILDF